MVDRGSSALHERIADQLGRQVDPAVARFAEDLARENDMRAMLFYGSNLRTGSLEGVLDFYRLLPGPRHERIWPRVSYHERLEDGVDLRAKLATMTLPMFAKAARGETLDTTIWARFVQPAALLWHRDEQARLEVIEAVAQAAITAARLAVALGPRRGEPQEYWRGLFRETYRAEFRVEKAGRENDILAANSEHFQGLLPLALEAGGIAYTRTGEQLEPRMTPKERARVLAWWRRRRRLGKPLNLARLAKASTTFEGAARYGAWKIERHTGMPVEVTPFRERHPLLAAPAVLWKVRQHRKHQG
ncbi:MAG: hypothetical protein WA985_03210 [Erythrobacter sp.]